MNTGIIGSVDAPPTIHVGLMGGAFPVPMPEQVYHSEAADWQRRVIANGGTVSRATMNAVNEFCYCIDAAGLRRGFYRLNLCCGDQLAAALVPLYRSPQPFGPVLGSATDAGSNFTSANYSEALGLQGGSPRFVNTGLNPATIPGASTASFHLSDYVVGTVPARVANVDIGCDTATSFVIGPWIGYNSSSVTACAIAGGLVAWGTSGGANFNQGFLLTTVNLGSTAQAAGSNRRVGAYGNGARAAPRVEAISAFPSREIYVCGGKGGGTIVSGGSARRYRGYTIGSGLSDGQISDLWRAMQRFNRALNRAASEAEFAHRGRQDIGSAVV